MDTTSTRRALIGAMIATPAIAATLPSAIACAPSQFWATHARWKTAFARFNTLPVHLECSDPARYKREEAAYLAAAKALDEAPVGNWQEFAAKFDHLCDQGDSIPPEDALFKLLDDARRLAAGGLN